MGVPVEHLAIPDAQRHEPKGAYAATAGHALFALGGDVTEFRQIDFADITGTPSFALAMVEELNAPSTTDQTVSAANASAQISFGPAQTVTNIDLSAAGTITFLTTGTYILLTELAACKVSGAASTRLFFRERLNAAEIDKASCVRFNGGDTGNQRPVFFQTVIEATAGDTYDIFFASDTNNTIGLISDPIPGGIGWVHTDTHSAHLRIYSFG